jgi:hypothetical protein
LVDGFDMEVESLFPPFRFARNPFFEACIADTSPYSFGRYDALKSALAAFLFVIHKEKSMMAS